VRGAAVLVGGIDSASQTIMLSKKPHILIGTRGLPARLARRGMRSFVAFPGSGVGRHFLTILLLGWLQLLPAV
jgi:hypothetical protein